LLVAGAGKCPGSSLLFSFLASLLHDYRFGCLPDCLKSLFELVIPAEGFEIRINFLCISQAL
jgi:hypothetical protein